MVDSSTSDPPSTHHKPTCHDIGQSSGTYQVRRPTGAEYDVNASDDYQVTRTTLRNWLHDGLHPVADVEVVVNAQHARGLIRSLKDLYDRHVDIEFDGRRIEEWFDCAHGFQQRALVVEMTDGIDDLSDAEEVRQVIAGLLFKDDDIHYDLSKTDAELPADLNAPIGSEIYVWSGQTLIWRMHPVARVRHGDSFAAVTATVVACRQATDELLDRIRALNLAQDDTTDVRLRSLVTAQASLERDIQARLDLLTTSIGRPAAAHLDALIRQTGLAERIRSVADLLARSRTTVDLELSLLERQITARAAASTADVRNVVVVFAVVSVLLSIVTMVIDLGALPEPNTARIPRLPTVIALAVLVSLGAAAGATSVVFAARTTLDARHVRYVRWLTAALTLVGAGGLIWVIRVPQLPVLVLSVGFVLSGAVLVAWQLRLAAAD